MTVPQDLIERVRTDDWCRKCNGTGWLTFKCGTPWMCTCNPDRKPIRDGYFMESEAAKLGRQAAKRIIAAVYVPGRRAALQSSEQSK